MNVIEPVTITDTILTASNVAEDDAAEWDAGTNYTTSDQVIRSHGVYEAVAPSTGQDPALDTVSAYWIRTGATNRWKAFDLLLSDPVIESNEITYSFLIPKLSDTITLLNIIAGSFQVVVTDPTDGEIYNETIELIDNSSVVDAWSYFFDDVIYATEYILIGVPIYYGTTVDLTVSALGTVQIGQIIIGRNRELGTTITGTEIGIEDYSKKDRDAFGNAIIVQRAFADTTNFQFAFPTSDAKRIRSILAGLRATPAVYFAGEDTSQYGTTVYGFFKDFSIPLTTNQSFGSLDVEGLT